MERKGLCFLTIFFPLPLFKVTLFNFFSMFTDHAGLAQYMEKTIG